MHKRLRLSLEKVLYLGKAQDRTFRKSWLMLRSPPVLSRFYAEGTSAERAATRTLQHKQRLETAGVIGSNLG